MLMTVNRVLRLLAVGGDVDLELTTRRVGADGKGDRFAVDGAAELVADKIQVAVEMLRVLEAIAELSQGQLAMRGDGVSVRCRLNGVVARADGLVFLVNSVVARTGGQRGLGMNDGGKQ